MLNEYLVMPDPIRFSRNDRKMLEMIIFIAHLEAGSGCLPPCQDLF